MVCVRSDQTATISSDHSVQETVFANIARNHRPCPLFCVQDAAAFGHDPAMERPPHALMNAPHMQEVARLRVLDLDRLKHALNYRVPLVLACGIGEDSRLGLIMARKLNAKLALIHKSHKTPTRRAVKVIPVPLEWDPDVLVKRCRGNLQG